MRRQKGKESQNVRRSEHCSVPCYDILSPLIKVFLFLFFLRSTRKYEREDLELEISDIFIMICKRPALGVNVLNDDPADTKGCRIVWNY